MKQRYSAAYFQNPIDKNDKIVITVSSKNGILFGPRTRVWIRKENNVYDQIGLIQKLKLKANAIKSRMKTEITFPKDNKKLSPMVRESLKNYKRNLKKLGVKIKKSGYEIKK